MSTRSESSPPRAAARGRFCVFALATIGLSHLVGCGAHPWQPAAPVGSTYQYDYQGFRASDTTVVAGAGGGGPTYGGVFAFRDKKGVHEEAGGKDPFTQSAPIDGMRFNTHLGGQGARLSPQAAPTSTPTPGAPPPPPTETTVEAPMPDGVQMGASLLGVTP
jgi:hypothetical protein